MAYETIRFIAVLAAASIISGLIGFIVGFSVGSDIAEELTKPGDDQ